MGRELFSPDEVLRLAIKIEENGKNFYESCLKFTDDKEVKELLKMLIRDEEKHKETFQEMLFDEEDKFFVESYAGDYESFMGALARECAFTQEMVEKKIKEGFESTVDLLDFALRMEKDSIILYTRLTESVLMRLEKIDKIIQEELRHFVSISKLKESYKQ